MPISAIYKIVNKTNGKYYVGSYIDPAGVVKDHIRDLENNNLHYPNMQCAFNGKRNHHKGWRK